MKVKELIKALSKCHKNAEVTICVDYTVEDEYGNNPRAPIEAINEEQLFSPQDNSDWREAILVLGQIRGKYLEKIKCLHYLKLEQVQELETVSNRIINLTSNRIEFANGECYALDFRSKLYYRANLGTL